MKIRMYINRTFRNSCNLMHLDIECSYFNLKSDELLIDNVIVASGLNFKKINSIEFLVAGYKNIITVNENELLKSTMIEFNKFENKYRNASDVAYFIKEI